MSDYPPPNRRPDGFNDEDLYKPFQWVALPPGEPERADACTWTYDDWHDYYDTTCGEGFCLDHEWSDKLKFCPYCGGRVSRNDLKKPDQLQPGNPDGGSPGEQ